MKHISQSNNYSRPRSAEKTFQPGRIRLWTIMILAGLCLYYGCRAAAKEDAALNARQDRFIMETLTHDGIARTYHIHLPPGFNREPPAPLVLALHGGGGEGRRFDASTTRGTLVDAADKRGVVLVFPEGIDKHWNDGRSEIFTSNDGFDDVGFLATVIDTMVQEYGIDPRRVYATGISNGGFMAVRLAVDLSDKIAAVAPVTAQLSKALEGLWPDRAISIMIVNGTEDPLVPFDGGHIRLFRFGRSRGEILSTAATVEHFRRHNGCGRRPEKVMLPDRDPADGTRVAIETYAGCREGTEVILVKVIGGGHTWPGGNQYLKPRIVGVVGRDIDASEMILDFFLNHSR
jgi:polyhydroxybutyrate depolymerase